MSHEIPKIEKMPDVEPEKGKEIKEEKVAKIPEKKIQEIEKREEEELEKVREKIKEKYEKEKYEKWAKDIPETLGTGEERQENYERFLEEFKKEREREDISEEEFQKRLEKAKEYVKNKLLYHSTSLKGATEIFQSKKILSAQKVIENKKREVKENLSEERIRRAFANHTYENDKKLGLDRFIYFSTDPLSYGEVALVMDNKILERPDCIASGEDIWETVDRRRDLFRGYNTYSAREINESELKEIINEYKKIAIPGKNFKEFYSHFIATYFENPSESFASSGQTEFQESVKKAEGKFKQQERNPFWIKKWRCPEVKVRNEVEIENIKKVLVKSKKEADFLISNGVPESLIWVGEEYTPKHVDWEEEFEKEQFNKSA